jgi:hypothetical protein
MRIWRKCQLCSSICMSLATYVNLAECEKLGVVSWEIAKCDTSITHFNYFLVFLFINFLSDFIYDLCIQATYDEKILEFLQEHSQYSCYDDIPLIIRRDIWMQVTGQGTKKNKYGFGKLAPNVTRKTFFMFLHLKKGVVLQHFPLKHRRKFKDWHKSCRLTERS